MKINLRNIMKKIKITPQKLFKALEIYESKKFQTNKAFDNKKSLIKIPNENNDFKNIISFIKKENEVISITFENDLNIKVGKNHILILDKDLNIEKEAKNLKIGDKIKIFDNSHLIIKSIELKEKDFVYDFQIDSPKKWYKTPDGIIHHNSLIHACLLRVYSKSRILNVFDRIDLITKESNNKLMFTNLPDLPYLSKTECIPKLIDCSEKRPLSNQLSKEDTNQTIKAYAPDIIILGRFTQLTHQNYLGEILNNEYTLLSEEPSPISSKPVYVFKKLIKSD